MFFFSDGWLTKQLYHVAYILIFHMELKNVFLINVLWVFFVLLYMTSVDIMTKCAYLFASC